MEKPPNEKILNQYKPGDVFQINENINSKGYIGAFIMAEEIRSWGIQGFISHIESHDEQRSIYLRPKWEQLEFIGHAPLIPKNF